MNNFCEQCGAKLREGVAFCSKCGASTGLQVQNPPKKISKEVPEFTYFSVAQRTGSVQPVQDRFEKRENRKRISAKTKKLVIAVLVCCVCLSIALVFMVTGCCISHDWQEATCTEPKICRKCGKIEGEELGHVLSTEATCTDPAICSVCEEIVDEALGHMWMAATCTEPKICNVCRKEEDAAIGHRIDSEGVCNVCGKSIGIDISANNWFDFFSIEYEWIYDESSIIRQIYTNNQGFHYTGCRILVTPLKEGNYENVVVSYTFTIMSDYGEPRGCFEIGDTMGEFMLDKYGNGSEEVIVTAYRKDPHPDLVYMVPQMEIEIPFITGHYTK